MSSRVLKNILLGFLFFTSLGLYSQTTYYVSKLGNNSNAGNFGAPFLTISHAVSVINPGDQIYIREGIYHENIVFNNIDASNGNKTLISNYNIEQYGTSSVKVYNRNGQLVFSKRNYQNDWGGTYQETGELLPAGSYYYLVEVRDTGKVKKGWLYLTY